MRREDKEITDRAMIEDIVNRAEVCRIACCDGDMPYVVPMNFGYRDGHVYLHTAREGRKLDILRRNNHVCFEVDVDHALVTADHSCGFDMRYRSVVASGKAFMVEDEEEKKRGLDIIMEHYGEEGPHIYKEKNLSLAMVVRIDVEEMTGKTNGY